MITIPALFNKSQRVIVLLFAITLFSIHPSKGQSITENGNNPLTLSINCRNNPQCVYSGEKTLFLTLSITNNSNQNLEIPLEAIQSISTTSYFQNIHTGHIVGRPIPPGMPIPEIFENLTLLPAHQSAIIAAGYSGKNMQRAFKEANMKQVIFYVETTTVAYYQGSKKPIGFYKNDIFEPKQFTIETKKIITKK